MKTKKQQLDLFDDNGAEFSADKKYRYALWRIWDTSKPMLMFIGLNPSTANSQYEDPTIRRVKRFAHDWNYGGVYMMNLFSQVTSNPKELVYGNDDIIANNMWLDFHSRYCEKIIFAWGNFPQAQERGKIISNVFPKNKCYVLGLNKNGSPKHPLYIKASTVPVLFNGK